MAFLQRMIGYATNPGTLARDLVAGAVEGAGQGGAQAIHLSGLALREEASTGLMQVLHSWSIATMDGVETVQQKICDNILYLFMHAHRMRTNDDTELDDISEKNLNGCIVKCLNKYEVIDRVKIPAHFAIIEKAVSEALIDVVKLMQKIVPGVFWNGKDLTINTGLTGDIQRAVNTACAVAMQTLFQKQIEQTAPIVINRHEEEVKALLRKGTSIGEEDNIRLAAKMMGKYKQESLVNSDITGFQFRRRNFRAIHWAAVNGNIKAIRYLSELKEFDVNALNFYKSTAIMSVLWAMEDAGQIAKVIDVLLDLKADPNLPNKDGMLPLTRAIRKFKNNSGPILKVLLKRADGRIKADAKKVVVTNKSAIALARELKLSQEILDLLRR